MTMLEHLLTADVADYAPELLHSPDDFASDETQSASQILDAKIKSADWASKLGLEDNEVVSDSQKKAAQQAFAALTTPLDSHAQKNAVAKIEVPQAVKHLVGMLTAYDWSFVDQAKELRGYAVAQLVEETKHPDAKVRLKALELLGKVTEVALFTDRVQVTKIEMTDEELEEQIRSRMERYMGLAGVVEDAEIVDADNADAAPAE